MNNDPFNDLLGWLDPDRERAARIYEDIRKKLIRIFVCRGCISADELADKTFDRVGHKVREIAPTYSGDPALYCYGVAHKIYLECLRKPQFPLAVPAPDPRLDLERDDLERDHECLEACMGGLPNGDRPLSNREIILQYYQEDKQAKIANRRRLADTLGISVGSLRILAHRIRAILEDCVLKCLRDEKMA